ncbi:MAG: hypothetical protein K2J08_01285 [Ruminococcus sp.]|nr:hypothetical protein [Ruminococcus sp.]
MGIEITDIAHIEKPTKYEYHSCKISLSAKNSQAEIKLYENNNIYWVDFECVNFDKEEIFCISVDSFENIDNIYDYMKKIETIMIT